MHLQQIRDTADQVENVWGEWADEVIMDAAREAATALRALGDRIERKPLPPQPETGYQGYTNRETWAFCLHYANDYKLYNRTLFTARGYLSEHPEASDRELGQHLIDYWQERAHEYTTAPEEAIIMLAREVGSWWRVDAAEVGAAVRESLSVEA